MHRVLSYLFRKSIVSIALYCFIAVVICLLRISPLLAERPPLEFGDSSFQLFIGDNSIEHKLDNIPLRRGIYQVELTYNATDDTILETGDDENYASPFIRGNRITLPNSEQKRQFKLYVETSEISAVIRMYESGSQINFSVQSITIYYLSSVTVIYYCLRTLVPFIVLFGCYLFIRFFRYKLSNEEQLILFGLLLVFIFVSVPLLADGYPRGDGNDSNVHILRIANIADGILSGSFPVRIQQGWYHDYGLPFGVYYPDAFLYPSALLHIFGVPLWISFVIYRLFVNGLAVYISYRCFYRISQNRYIGFIVCTGYLTSVRFLINNYLRDAQGETLSMTFLPLIALAFVTLARKHYHSAVNCFIIGFTGVLQSHIITTRSVLVFCVLTGLVGYKVFINRKALGAILIAAVATFFINMGMIIPFLHYYLKNNLVRPNVLWNVFHGSGTTLGELLFYSTREFPYAMGIIPILVFVILLYRFVAGKGFKHNYYVALTTIVSLFAIWMSTKYFPYDTITKFFPFMDHIIGSDMQLKTRYLTIATVACYTLLALVLMEYQQSEETILKIVGLLQIKRQHIYVACLLLSALQAVRIQRDYLNSATLLRAVDKSGCEMVDEPLYVLDGTDTQASTDRSIYCFPEDVSIDSIERKGMTFSFNTDNQTVDTAYIDLPIWNYPGYRAGTTGSGEKLGVTTGTNNRVRIAVPPGYTGQIECGYQEPWFWRVSEVIAIISFIVFVIILRKNNSEEGNDLINY